MNDARPRKPGWWERPSPDLSFEDLARFLAPMTWPEIRAIEPRRAPNWWRSAIVGADDHGGLGLLTWLKRDKAWVLTDRGRRHIDRVRTVH